MLVGTPGTDSCWDPIAKHISNPDSKTHLKSRYELVAKHISNPDFVAILKKGWDIVIIMLY